MAIRHLTIVKSVFLPLLLILCLSSCSLSFSKTRQNTRVEAVTVHFSPIAHKPVVQWSVTDVEYWMNHTVGYPEYSGFVRKHLVDGPTLLDLEPADMEEHFPIEHAMHVIKLAAHLRLLKGLCLCKGTEVAPVDFWSYFKKENFRVWVVGVTSFFFPRVAMLYTFLFDDELYSLLLGVTMPQSNVFTAAAKDAASVLTRTVPLLHTFLFLFCTIAAPDLFMAFKAAFLLPTNYILMPCFILHFLCQGYSEYVLLHLLYKGEAFQPGMSFRQKIWEIFSFTLFVPPAVLLLYPFIPYFVQTICIWLLAAYTLPIIAGTVFILFSPNPTSNTENHSERK